jgi:hypothetical protein
MLVVDRNPDVPVDRRHVGPAAESSLDGRAHVKRRHDPMIAAHPRIRGARTYSGIGEAVIGTIQVQLGNELIVSVEERAVADVHVVHDRGVRRVDAALERLQEVAILE